MKPGLYESDVEETYLKNFRNLSYKVSYGSDVAPKECRITENLL